MMAVNLPLRSLPPPRSDGRVRNLIRGAHSVEKYTYIYIYLKDPAASRFLRQKVVGENLSKHE